MFCNCHVSIVGQDANKSVAITERKKRRMIYSSSESSQEQHSSERVNILTHA